MAEPDHSTPGWGSMSATSTVTQGWDRSAPHHLNARAGSFPPPFPPPPYNTSYNTTNNAAMFHHSNVFHPPLGNHAQGRSPYSHDESQQRPVYYHPSSGMYPTQPRLPSAFRHGPVPARTDMNGWSDVGDLSPRLEYPMMHHGPGFMPAMPMPPCPPYDVPLSPPTSAVPFPRRFQNAAIGLRPPASYGWQDGLPVPESGSSDRARQVHFHGRRPSQQEPPPHNNRPYDHTERRAERRAAVLNAQSRRSDRSVSPLNSNRRSFDRFSYDFPQTSTSSGAEEAAARVPPSNRARRLPREPRPRFFGRPSHHDPNIATPQQIQELKDKLPRRLPSELPEETSSACDICSKDYSITHVQPAEEEEIAIELPCGHCFGEFCIFQWFDTCRAHKNKVTCPMCRKLLIEPSRYHPALLDAISRGSPAFQEMLALQGDFAHVS